MSRPWPCRTEHLGDRERPTLGKVFELIYGDLASPLSWPPVYRTSTESAGIHPSCRAIYYKVGPSNDEQARTPEPVAEAASN